MPRANEPLLLPRGPGGARVFGDDRGTKALKLDLEAAVALPDGRLLLFGSGSTPRREHVAIVTPSGAARIVHLEGLYAALRACDAFSGSELNVEGAVVLGERLRLFNRGNGAPRDGRAPVNAHVDIPLPAFTAALDAPGMVPPLESVTAYALGELGGVALGITGATRAPDGRVVLALAAEDSPDATRDGDVTGAGVAVAAADGLRWAPLTTPEGAPAHDKIEGIALADALPGLAYLVTDPDDDARPSELLTVELRGPW